MSWNASENLHSAALRNAALERLQVLRTLHKKLCEIFLELILVRFRYVYQVLA